MKDAHEMLGFVLGFLKLWFVCQFTFPEIYGFKIALKKLDDGPQPDEYSWLHINSKMWMIYLWIVSWISDQSVFWVEVVIQQGGQVLR